MRGFLKNIDFKSNIVHNKSMAHVSKSNFNTQLLQRDTLSEEQKLVSEAQGWFNKLVQEYLQNIQKEWWIIAIHRAILICILNNESTMTLEFALEKRVKMGPEEFDAERFYIKCSWRSYVICIHDEESFTGWIIQFNDKDKYTLSVIWTEELQQEWKKVVNKIKRAGLLEVLSSKKKTDENREKILKILQSLDSEAINDFEETITKLKKQRQM